MNHQSPDKKFSIDQEDLEIVVNILKQAPIDFYAYGSRAKGTNKKFSDLDLCYKQNLSQEILYRLMDDFEESDLPFKVDLADYNKCTNQFKELIDRDLMKI